MRCLFAALLVFLLISCKKEADTADPGNTYPKQAVGTVNNGAYTITKPDEIKKSWETYLGGTFKLAGFEIVKGKTEGDAVEDFYMIVARTEDGAAKVASLLELKSDKFYLGSVDNEGPGAYRLVVCKGECDNGCLPVVMIRNGAENLICSSCADCEKNEIGVH